MKKIRIIILLTAIIMFGFYRNAQAEDRVGEKPKSADDKNESAKVTYGKSPLSIEQKDSALNLRTGNRGLAILESLEGPSFNITGYSGKEDWDQEDNDHERRRRRSRFRGHWSGLELGFNNYLSSDKSFAMPDNIDYMTLQSSKSCNFNINFTQLSLGLTRHFGFVTGLGLNWNNYRFDGNNNIVKGPDGIIEELDPGSKLDKSKLATLFLTLPLMLEIQIPVDNNRLHIAAGPIGALKLTSHTKMVFEDGHTVKSWGDLSLNMLRYGATARVGYGNFQIFGTYYATPLFQSGKGPAGYDLYPFEIGLALAFNN
jgi:Outer membrane protein beta-barrel domain